MISEEQYKAASAAKDEAQKTINQFFLEQSQTFEERMKTNPIFTDDELFYSATSRCPCGAGLAYPKKCGPFHYWDCSAILTGTANKAVKHADQLPFAFYDVKGESEYNGTTRQKITPGQN